MGNWNDLLNEVKEAGNAHDVVRRKYLAKLSDLTGRNTIIYYSGWLQKRAVKDVPTIEFFVGDTDKNAFMATVHRLDRDRGLDLVLHTPGGSIAATESLVEYLRALFKDDIRAIVPQIAMSAGTMIALACREIVMGEHSSLGPIDPQIGVYPAHAIIEEFNRARREITENPINAALWQPIIAKYSPTVVGEAEKAIEWSTEIVQEWLTSCMFDGLSTGRKKAARVVRELGDHALMKSHDRHISLPRARELGLRVVPLEKDNKLQDAVLSVHHATVQTLGATAALKVVENQLGVAHITSMTTVLIGPS